MFEGLAAWLLKTYIGKYINVNPDKLSIGLLSGVIELENVPLNPINDYDFPFEIKFGYIGKIKLNVSLNTLRYSPWSLLAENICVLIGPKKLTKPTPESGDEEKFNKEKLDKLINIENKWFKEVELLGIDDEMNKSDRQSLFFKLLAPMAYSLLNNIHISLNGLHIRFEDPENNYSIGAIIETITVKNDNDPDILKDLENKESLSCKLFELKNFSIYTDSNIYFKSDDTYSNFNSIIEANSYLFNYIIQPTSFKAYLIRDITSRPIRKRKKPRIRIRTILNNFNLNLNQIQIKYLNEILKLMNKYKNFTRSKQVHKPSEFQPKQFWTYLVKCVLVQIKKPNRTDLIKWSKDVNLYRKAIELEYCSIALEPDLLNEKERIEKEWDFDRLFTIRRVIFEKFLNSPNFKLKLLNNSQSLSKNNYLNIYGYFTWRLTNLASYYFNKTPTKDVLETSEHNNIDDEVIGLINDTMTNDSLFRRDSLLAVLEFKLENSEICLGDNIALFKLEKTHVTIEALPRYDSYTIEMSLGAVYLIDNLNQTKKTFPLLIKPKSLNEPFSSVFNLIYDYKPYTKMSKFTSNLKIKSSGFDIIFNKSLYEKLIEFFRLVNMYQQDASVVLIKNYEKNTSKNEKKSISFSPISAVHKIDFDFEITAPKLIIPEDCELANPTVLILDFGKLIFKNKEKSIEANNISNQFNQSQSGNSSLNFMNQILNDDNEDEDGDEEFATPIATPPNEFLDDEYSANSLFKLKDNYLDFYSNFDLNLNDLQVLSGKYSSDNLMSCLSKGRSSLHLLEKFDINFKIGVYKFKLNKNFNFYLDLNENSDEENAEPNSFTPLRININVNLLKLNVDDLKIINFYNTIQNFKSLFNDDSRSKSKKFKFPPNLINNVKAAQKFLDIEFKINEVDVTMSACKSIDDNQYLPDDILFIDSKSICEFKIYMINSEINLNSKFDLNFKLSLYNMLLIDARQIYGPDYQLLAASHENILLDTRTGIIINRLTGLKEDLSKNVKPLIYFDLAMTKNNSNDYNEIVIESSFSTLDIILNPETISEIIILLYSIYLNLKAEKENSHLELLEAVNENETLKTESEIKTKINFNFNRLSLLLFRIEDEDLGLARKIGLFALDGVSINACLIPELKYFDIESKVDGFNVTDLSKNDPSLVFGIGLDNLSSSHNFEQKIFELNFKKSIKNSECCKDLKIKIASLCYVHSAKLINDIQCCFKDLMRFHAKIMEEVTDKAAVLAFNMLKKGKIYLENKLVETNLKKDLINIKISLETPVISIPVNQNEYFIAHLGHLKIKNERSALDLFQLNLKDINMFSIDSKVEYEHFKSNKKETSSILTSSTNNRFKIFYSPIKKQNLIDKTDINLTISYRPKKFNSLNSYLTITSKLTNTCKITLSKSSLEQLTKISDSIIYVEKSDLIKAQIKTKPINFSQLNQRNIHVEDQSQSQIFEFLFQDSSSESDQDEIESQIRKLDLNIDINFKIEKLEINFLGDVERPLQEIAELCFNEYELNINKSQKYITNLKMTLKSLHLIDKLVKNQKNLNNYLLFSDSGTIRNHQCELGRKPNIKTENLSYSAPCLGKNLNLFNYNYKKSKSKKKTDPLNNIFELTKFYNCVSTSLPSELSNTFNNSSQKKNNNSNKNELKLDESNKMRVLECPTPPPSPTSRRKKRKNIRKSESMSNINAINECSLCDSDPLVKINLLLVDEKNVDFSTKFKSINRFVNIKFSRLKLNVNPETWILVLDLLGLGSKAYPINKNENETFIKKDFKDEQSEKSSSSTGIKFKVEQFTIQLNENESESRLAKFRVNNVKAFIETRPGYLKSDGKLGSLIIYDVSSHKGLYTDRFLTSGNQALEFEFFKHIGPPKQLEKLHEFDIFFKLKMSSVKYVHTQRFIVTLTNYFQQFNQLQDALGKMRALSLGQKNIAYTAQRSSRVKLDIQTEAPIIVIPVNNKSPEVLVFNLGNIEVKNRFLISNELNQLNSSINNIDTSYNNSFSINDDEQDCLLDLIDVTFIDTHLYSGMRYIQNLESLEDLRLADETKRDCSDVKFLSFGFKQISKSILKQENSIIFNLERNLENEISHKSPDWFVYSKLSSVLISIDLEQYKLIRGLFDQNIGEQVKQSLKPVNLLIPNPSLETVLTGKVWKQISLNFDLVNVDIELLNENKSITFASLTKSSLVYESFSDASKLIDWVSNEINIKDTRNEKFFNILSKKIDEKSKRLSGEKKLQLEIHSRSNKNSNRYSILFNNCRVITLIDWIMEIRDFLTDYKNDSFQNEGENRAQKEQPIVVKVNLTNTDFVLVENIENLSSQAIILRLTAFLEYNQRKMDQQPIESCLQSLELFSCQMNAIEQTALSIIEPVTINIYMKKKSSIENNYLFEISTQKLRLRFSYLDFKLFFKVLKSVQKQIEKQKKIMSVPKVQNESNKIASTSNNLNISDFNLWMSNFSICIIDDCNDIDIPLGDIQFNRFTMLHNVKPGVFSGQGSVEFVLNLDYYNRLLSGWEPLVEPWLARLDWKFKPTTNVFTLTSMDVLNFNLTNPFIQILSNTLSNWKKDFNDESRTKIHKVFQPYKLVNHTGESIKFLKFQNTDLDENFEWETIEDKMEKEFNFFKVKHFTNTHDLYAQRTHNNQLRKLVQNKIKVKLDDWTEIKTLTIDKVGTYFRDIYRQVPDTGPSMTRLIFDITLKENATKQIEIKSPVSIKNRLNFRVQIRIESSIPFINSKLGPLILEIDTDREISIPIKYLPCNIWFKPIDLDMNLEAEFSSNSVNITDINQQVEYFQLTCKLKSLNDTFIKQILKTNEPTSPKLFYFFAKIKKLNFPSTNPKQKHNYYSASGHSIYIEPAFSLYNLLPVEFRYKFLSQNKTTKVIESSINGKIDPNKLEHFNDINVSKPIDFLIDLDNFRVQKSLEINPTKLLSNLDYENDQSSLSTNRRATLLKRVNLFDEKNRPLFLIARIIFKLGSITKPTSPSSSRHNSFDEKFFIPCPIVLHISAVYCFFNLTGLPLVFRQYNCDEAAGQLDEHETVCSNQPLLFSYNEIDSPYACSMRIGKNCIDFKEFLNINKKSIIPKWCKPFGLDSGSSFRALQVINNSINETETSSKSYLNPDWVYYIGIEIKQGKGLLKDTTFVYFSTRYYLVNKSSNDLLLSQYYFIREQREKGVGLNWNIKRQLSNNEQNNSILLLKDSMSQFHWPRADFDQLLSVRLNDDLNYNWSGGFKIDTVESFYIPFRHLINTNDFFYLKCEIFLDGGTFYIVFTDKIDFPFPVRIENQSEVPIYFYQPLTLEEKFNIYIKPKEKLNYTWDERIFDRKLLIGVKGGTSALFDLSLIEESKNLYYENFFCIAFIDQNKNQMKLSSSNISNQDLVLTYSKNKVYLDFKEPGNRSQLWSLTTDGYLIHEGSSPPREIDHNVQPDLSTSYVLDIEDVAPRPNHLISLTLRRPDIRRKNTQKWNFDQNGHLCCNVRNMCLQYVGELKKNARVVLGPILNTQTVLKQQLRPGSGYLSVQMLTDGPTRVIKIANIRNKSYLSINWEKFDDQEDLSIEKASRNVKKSIEIYVNLTGGIGISIIQWKEQEYEELIYAYFKSIELSYDQNSYEQKLMLGIQSIQVCNQLLNAMRQNLLYSQTNMIGTNKQEIVFKKHDLALKIDFLRKFRSKETPIYIEHLIIDFNLDLNLQVEEKLLWKLIQFMGLIKLEQSNDLYGLNEFEMINVNDAIGSYYYKNQISKLLSDSQAIKYSFSKFQINRINITLSVYKTPKLSNDLQKIKSSLGIPLIQFENASIECKPFILMNEHDTASCILNLISKHYTQELRSHAIRILGSVDFLGNPLGLMVDFKESLSNILSNGHVTDFVFSITHGVANSVSKFSGSLSDELNELTMDERHQETREQIRSLYNNGSVDHFVGGALGFAVGIVGGALSLATQTYRGYNESGVSGVFAGLGRGAVGTVSKPIVGMLDFATGIASAIKETSKTINKMEIPRVRESRCCSTSGALLSQFSRADANGQKILYQVNNFSLDEKYIAMEQLKCNKTSSYQIEQSIGIVTNQRILFVKNIDFDFRIDYEYTYQQLNGTSILEDKDCAYLELSIEKECYRFTFENKEAAKSFENKIRNAKADYDELFYILHNYKEDEN